MKIDLIKYKIRNNEKPKLFFDIYNENDLIQLPDDFIVDSKNLVVVGDNSRTVINSNGVRYHLDNPLNNLTGSEWLKFTKSVFSTWFPTNGKKSYAHNIRKIHPSPKPPQLMQEIIEFFTKKNELVFDYFMGVGGTLLGAALCNREACGIDLNQKYIDTYYVAAEQLNLTKFETRCANSIEFLKSESKMLNLTKGKDISLLLIDPPYSNMMNREKTGAYMYKYGKSSTPFTNSNFDLGNMETIDFLNSLKESIILSLPYIKFRGYVVVFIKDLQPKKKKLNLLHYDVIQKLNEIPNLNYKGLRIWVDDSAKLFPYGYPYSFVSNQIHQYILVFRKEK